LEENGCGKHSQQAVFSAYRDLVSERRLAVAAGGVLAGGGVGFALIDAG
jgi:hypothetical protein